MDDEELFVLGGGDVPGSADELDGVGRADSAWDVKGKMQIEQFWMGRGSEFRALFCERFVPGLIGGEAGGAMFVRSVEVSDFGVQELVGVLVSVDFFIGKESHQPSLHGAEEPFDFAFGLRGGSHAVVDSDGR